jgi:nucleoside-diphosphate-sugar epimerase
LIVGVTGGTGFVGRRLVEQLVARGDRVRILSRQGTGPSPPAAERFRGDLCGAPDELARFVGGLDILYHCAGETRDEARMRATNVDGTRNLLAAAAGRIGRWVQLSSVGAYGSPRSRIVREDAPARPAGEYEVTKTEADEAVIGRSTAHRFTHAVVRPCKIMGIGMRDRSLYALFPLVERGLFFYVGKPGALLNYVHVDDVARALVLAGSTGSAAGIFNVARQITVEEFTGTIAQALGVRPPRIRLPEAPTRALAALTTWLPGNPLTAGRVDGLTSSAVYASDRIRAELGFEFSVSIQDGLRELVADWRAGRG